MNIFNFCQNCQVIVRVDEDFTCEICSENICIICGCTDSETCANSCDWLLSGVCTSHVSTDYQEAAERWFSPAAGEK